MTQGTTRSDPLRPVPECSDACVRGMLRGASCAACALACPEGAIDIAPRGITIDPAACNGCGQCAGACPGRALSAPPLPEVRGNTVALTCTQAGAPGTVGCVHSLGQEALSALWLSGARQITLRIGDCDACPDGPDGAPFAEALALVNRLLEDREQPGLRLTTARAADPDAPSAPARRALFRRLSRPERITPSGPQLAAVQRQAEGQIFAHVAEINAISCTGCDACVQICPEGALTLVKDGAGELWYDIASSKCTGCQLCQDVCDSNAIELRSPGADAAPVPLRQSRCPCCGVDTHVPRAKADTETRCRICRTAPHASNLFVVLPD